MAIIENIKSQCSIIEYLNGKGLKGQKHGKQMYYNSPIREGDNDKSFAVTMDGTKWIDFGGGDAAKGDIITLVEILEACSKQEAISKLSQQLIQKPEKANPNTEKKAAAGTAPEKGDFAQDERRQVTAVLPVEKKTKLMEYITSRGISEKIAIQYLRCVEYRQDGKFSPKGYPYFAIGMKTTGGWELRNHANGTDFKSHIGKKKPSFFQGKTRGGNILLFEGMFDFLTALEHSDTLTLPFDAIVLHSGNNLTKEVLAFIKQWYQTADAYVDNDAKGDEVISKLVNNGLKVMDFRKKIYPHHNDYNAFWCWRKQLNFQPNSAPAGDPKNSLFKIAVYFYDKHTDGSDKYWFYYSPDNEQDKLDFHSVIPSNFNDLEPEIRLQLLTAKFRGLNHIFMKHINANIDKIKKAIIYAQKRPSNLDFYPTCTIK
ncbi:toprim domain-containing protein [Limibacter armeniacum]|uniref:toprim domain-containing protein n=1 Tax=Limibacter armeniacum TaxID=466084 RepID=UPI002FE5B320